MPICNIAHVNNSPLFHSISKRFNKKQSYYIVKLPCIPRFNNTWKVHGFGQFFFSFKMFTRLQFAPKIVWILLIVRTITPGKDCKCKTPKRSVKFYIGTCTFKVNNTYKEVFLTLYPKMQRLTNLIIFGLSELKIVNNLTEKRKATVALL